MKRYLLALFYFLSVGWMPLSVHAANSDIWAIQGYGKLNNVDVENEENLDYDEENQA